jgi:hypothetical protein
MADSDPAVIPSRMMPPELMAFAARLRASGNSAVMRGHPALQRDLKLAAALVNRLANLLVEIRHAAEATEDESTERHLRELLGGD